MNKQTLLDTDKFLTDHVVEYEIHDGSDGMLVDSKHFDWTDAETVTLEDTPYPDAFGTDTFYAIDATVAKPLVQKYEISGETYFLEKTEESLRGATWQLENLPWVIDHPRGKTISTPEQIRGFWRDARYVDGEGQRATLHFPVTDDVAKEVIKESKAVSIGFTPNEIEWTLDNNTQADAKTQKLLYDHVASVRKGRCSIEDGCGLDAPLTDAVRSEQTQSDYLADGFHPSVGDWVTWEDGAAHGKVDEVVTDGCTSRGLGEKEVCADGDDPAVVVEVYDDETGESQDEYVRHKGSTLNSWRGAMNDAAVSLGCSDGPCSCGRHVRLRKPTVDEASTLEDLDLTPPQSAQDDAQQALDWKDEYEVDAMTETGWARARQLASGDELSPADISDGSGAMAPWHARHEGNEEINDEYEGEPWRDNGRVAFYGWGGEAGRNWAYRMDEKITEIRSADDSHVSGGMSGDGTTAFEFTMTDSDGETSPFSLDEIATGALIDRHDGVSERLGEKENRITELENEIESLEDSVDEKEDTIESLNDTLVDHVRDDFEAKRDTLVSVTDRYEAETLNDSFKSADGIDAKREVVEDMSEKIALVDEAADIDVEEATEDVTDTPLGDSGIDGDDEEDDTPTDLSGRDKFHDLRTRTD